MKINISKLQVYFLILEAQICNWAIGISLKHRRDQLTIMMDLLEMLTIPTKLTEIFNQSNMGYNQLIKYLTELEKLKFIGEYKEPVHEFAITKNGIKFLELIQLEEPKISFDGF